MRGNSSLVDQRAISEELLAEPRYGGLLVPDSAAFQALLQREAKWDEQLQTENDALPHRPSQALPLLLRELAQCAGLDGFDPVGSVQHQ